MEHDAGLVRRGPAGAIPAHRDDGHAMACPYNNNDNNYWNVMNRGDGLSFTTSSRVSIGWSFL